MEIIRKDRLSRPSLPVSSGILELVDTILDAYDQVRDGWFERYGGKSTLESVTAEAINKIRGTAARPKRDTCTYFVAPHPILTPDLARVAMAGGSWWATVAQSGAVHGIFHFSADAQAHHEMTHGLRLIPLDTYLRNPEVHPPAVLNEVQFTFPSNEPEPYQGRLIHKRDGVEFQVRVFPDALGNNYVVNGEVWKEHSPDSRFSDEHGVYSTTAAEVVAAWASYPNRSRLEVILAHYYLSRWPEGPQIPLPKE
jgi:hypothetical protein